MKKNELVLSLTQRLILLFCLFLVCYMLTMAGSYVVGRLLSSNYGAAIRISAVLQDVLTFIVPAVLTALLVTRRPAALLCLTRRPGWVFLLGALTILVVSIPFQEAVIYWNYHISLPESMASLEASARAMEEAAFQAVKSMLSDSSVAALIVNILIVGCFAGLSEELLFRGCFQRLLTTGGVNPHLAIWLVAFCFSALHFQLFGFVPRLLLGAYFGYLLLWSGSIWVPVAAHVLNNVMFVVASWHSVRTGGVGSLSNEPTLWPALATVASAVLTAVALWWLRRSRVQEDYKN